jgi:acyl carrier protein
VRTGISRMQFPTVLDTWGMREFVEPRIRSLVADHLGVGIETLASVASLRDDLAVDSLDLLELAMLLEQEFAITVSDTVLQGMHCYDDIVGTIVRLIAEGRDDPSATPASGAYEIAPLLAT